MVGAMSTSSFIKAPRTFPVPEDEQERLKALAGLPKPADQLSLALVS
jgi:hypothetical protein